MLGCKFYQVKMLIGVVSWINRYMLGCKYVSVYSLIMCVIELIDTCWDVNMSQIKVENDYIRN